MLTSINIEKEAQLPFISKIPNPWQGWLA